MAEIDTEAAENAAREGSLDFAPGAWGGAVGDWGSAGFNGINTGNPVMDFIIGAAFPGLGVPDWLAQQHWGDGVAARGSSNDFTEGGGASTGFNDDARGIENIINALLNRQNPTTPTTTPRVPRGGTEGGRRPSGGSMRSQYMPSYRGVSAGRNRRGPNRGSQYDPATGMESRDLMIRKPGYGTIPEDGTEFEFRRGGQIIDDLSQPIDGISYAGGSKWFDESTGQRRPGAPPLGPNQKGYVPQVGGTGAGRLNNWRSNIGQMALPERGDGSGNSVGSNGLPRVLSSFLPGLSSVQGGNNALTALSSFIPQANKAASDRSGQMTSYLDKLLQRGDIAEDGASINAAVSPRLQRGRNNALSSIMMGNRVSDNLYDMSNLGADIGGRQGAQNVDVRGRIPSRVRRF